MAKEKLEMTKWERLPPLPTYMVDAIKGNRVERNLSSDCFWRINSHGHFEVLKKPMSGRNKWTQQAGKTTVEVLCPFCGTWVRAYVWSLAGCGKRCSCKALLGSGAATKSKPMHLRLHQTAAQFVEEYLAGATSEVKHD